MYGNGSRTGRQDPRRADVKSVERRVRPLAQARRGIIQVVLEAARIRARGCVAVEIADGRGKAAALRLDKA